LRRPLDNVCIIANYPCETSIYRLRIMQKNKIEKLVSVLERLAAIHRELIIGALFIILFSSEIMEFVTMILGKPSV
jgi:hypothetical protein